MNIHLHHRTIDGRYKILWYSFFFLLDVLSLFTTIEMALGDYLTFKNWKVQKYKHPRFAYQKFHNALAKRIREIRKKAIFSVNLNSDKL